MAKNQQMTGTVIPEQPSVIGRDTAGNQFYIPVQPQVTAEQIAKPQPQVKLPQPKLPTSPDQFVERLSPAIEQSSKGLIRAETEEAKRRDDVLSRLLDVDNTSSQDVYDRAFSKAGGDEYLKQFTDANTKLATLQGKFRSAKQAVSTAPGQSQVFEGLQLSEVGRQEAVEVGNQALVVAALQGNVETARQIALDTSRFANEDRMFKLQNLSQQFDALNGIVTGQEAQLLEQEKQRVEAEKAALERLQTNIDTAITSGSATVEEMQQLASTTVPDDQKLAIAQQIISRTAADQRQYDRFVADRDFNEGVRQFEAGYELSLAELSLQEQELLGKNPAAEINPTTGEVEVQLSEDQLRKVDMTNEKKNLDALANLQLSAQRYRDLVDQEGWAGVGTGRALLEGAYADLKVKWKEAANLGALTGPDLDLIIEAVKPSTGLKGLKQKFIGGGKDGLLQQIDRLKGNITEDGQRYYDQLIKRNEEYQYSPYVQSLGKPFGITTPGQQRKADDLFNQTTGGSEGTNPKAPLGIVNTKTLASKIASKFPTGSVGGQCGVFVRKVANSLGFDYPRLGDSLKSKMAAVQKYGTSPANAGKGSVIVTKENPTYGHVAYIIGQNKNGWIVAESNFKQSEKVSYGRVIPYNSQKIVGVINPSRKT